MKNMKSTKTEAYKRKLNSRGLKLNLSGEVTDMSEEEKREYRIKLYEDLAPSMLWSGQVECLIDLPVY